MGVAGERQGNAWRHTHEDVRLVGEQDHRVVGRDLGEGPCEIVFAAKGAGPEPVGDLIAEACNPEPCRTVAEQHGPVLEAGNASLHQGAADRADIVPPVVVAPAQTS
jgi:hypothetical protein